MDNATQEKADQFFDKIQKMELKSRRASLIDAGILIECSRTARKAGISEYKVGMTKTLWNHLFPFAEDAVKGGSFEENLWDVFKVFQKELCNGPQGKSSYGEFAILAKTHVKKVVGKKVYTFENGKSRTKRIEIIVTYVPDENLQPSLVFGLKRALWV